MDEDARCRPGMEKRLEIILWGSMVDGRAQLTVLYGVYIRKDIKPEPGTDRRVIGLLGSRKQVLLFPEPFPEFAGASPAKFDATPCRRKREPCEPCTLVTYSAEQRGKWRDSGGGSGGGRGGRRGAGGSAV